MPTDTVSIEDFITTNRIKSTAVRTYENRNMPESHDMDHWQVTLRRSTARMTLTFSMGYGLKGAEPKTAEVLDCLVSDSASIEGTDFESWCGDLGYDPDSRKAEKIYKTCEHQSKRLRKFLGDELYDQLLYHTEKRSIALSHGKALRINRG